MGSSAPLGGGDCELIRTGWLGQPANPLSSLAFVAAGIWLLWRGLRSGREHGRRLALFGVLEIATGVGSVMFHGPMGPGAPFLHDSSFLAVLLLLLVINVADISTVADAGPTLPRWEVGVTTGVVPLATLTAVVPSWVNGLTVLLVASAVIAETRLWSSRLRLTAQRRGVLLSVALFAAAGGFYVLGRTEAAWCDPASLFQPHAVWHVLVAAAMAVYAHSIWGLESSTRRPDVRP